MVSNLTPSSLAISFRLRPAQSNCCARAMTSGVMTDALRVARGVKNASTPPARYLATLRMTLLFETPKARTISAWWQAPWQISWAVNMPKERRSLSAC